MTEEEERAKVKRAIAKRGFRKGGRCEVEEEEADPSIGDDDDDGPIEDPEEEADPSPSLPGRRDRRRRPRRPVGDDHEEKDDDDDDAGAAIRTVEGIARIAFLLCGACLLGASHPEWSSFLGRTLEFLLASWATCLVISAVEWSRSRRRRMRRKRRRSRSRDDEEEEEAELFGATETTPLLLLSTERDDDREEKPPRFDDEDPAGATRARGVAAGAESRSSSLYDDVDVVGSRPRTDGRQTGPDGFEHPKLATAYCIDTNSGDRLQANTFVPYRISNEWMDAAILVMIRTTNEPTDPEGTARNERVLRKFTGKKRQFEFQFQIKLKRIPIGKRMYFACDLNDPIKMGFVTKAFVSAAMAFVKTTNPNMHYNVTGSRRQPDDGSYERPHIAFTAETSLDRFVVTKPGDTPPELGTELVEDRESMKRRKTSGELTDWNLEDTYTFSIWSSYADFLEWKIQNLPGIKPFGLQSVLGDQSMNLSLYLIDVGAEGGDHLRKDITELVRMEVSNGEKSSAGRMAKEWIDGAEARARSLSSARAAGSNGVVEVVDESSERASPDEIDDDDDEVEMADAADAAELGEGIYLRSGDSVLLRELPSDDDEDGGGSSAAANFVVNGGKFAVLSKQSVAIVIEKVKGRDKCTLIKSGDTVLLKMIEDDDGDDDGKGTRYLTIHQGWWLKWSTKAPSKNNHFTIRTDEADLSDRGGGGGGGLPFLTLGGSFSLRHKRWARYEVGVSSKPSADFGGRMLCLRDSSKRGSKDPAATTEQATMSFRSDDDEGDVVDAEEMPSIGGESKYVKPLVLCTQDPHGFAASASSHRSSDENDPEKRAAEPRTPSGRKLRFSSAHSRADVPAWIEMLDRKRRVRQLAYVVRVVRRDPEEENAEEEEIFARLKCGKGIARITNVGKRIRASPVTTPKTLATASSFGGGETDADAMVKSESYLSFSGDSIGSSSGIIRPVVPEYESISSKRSASGKQPPAVGLYIDTDELIPSATKDEYDASPREDCESIEYSVSGDWSSSSSSIGNSEIAIPRKNKGLRKKLKKLGKKTVTETGRFTRKTAKNTARKTSQYASNKIFDLSLKAGKPPRKEPKKRGRERQDGISKEVKKLGKLEAKYGGPPVFIAGELSATEQARRTVSRVLARMSDVPTQSPAWRRCNDALSSQLGFATDQDAWFLDGDEIDLGIKPSGRKRLTHRSVVARCLCESHWREEWCGVYESSLSFYVPLAKSACYEISYSDITLVRELRSDDRSPLPGYSIAAVETAWQCHYLAFRDEPSRDLFRDKIVEAQERYRDTGDFEATQLRKARFWRGFQTLSEPSLAAGTAKWAKVSSNQKLKERAILNGRRMPFDRLNPSVSSMSSGGKNGGPKAHEFVEELLRTALTFSYAALEKDPESFVEFLDLTCELRFLPLGEIDLSSPRAFCMFVNLYHCLLQHALLLSVNGPLNKKTISHFVRTSCYEIGGDIFSLGELHSCVICGKMSPRCVGVPKKSDVTYRYYALDYTDARVHFLLSTADAGSPAEVPILTEMHLGEQLNAACVGFLAGNRRQLSLDARRRSITLPRACEVYRNYFSGGAVLGILEGCLCDGGDEMDDALRGSIWEIVENGLKGLTVKFQNGSNNNNNKNAQEQYHSSLRLLVTTATAAAAANNNNNSRRRDLEPERSSDIVESNG